MKVSQIGAASFVAVLSLVAVGLATVGLVPPAFTTLQWESIGPNGGSVDGFAQARSNPDRMYVLLSRQGIQRSDDHGATWQRVDSIFGEAYLRALAVSPFDEDLVLVGAPQGMMRSTDGGVTWQLPVTSPPSGATQIEFSPIEESLVLAVGLPSGPDTGVFRSTDGGIHWELAASGVSGTELLDISFHPTDPATVLVAANPGTLFQTTNAGNSWDVRNLGGFETLSSVDYSPLDPEIVWAAGTPVGVSKSTDGGTYFTSIPNQPNCSDWYCYPSVIAAGKQDPFSVLCAVNIFRQEQKIFWVSSFSSLSDGGDAWSDPYWSNFPSRDSGVSALSFDHAEPSHAYASISLSGLWVGAGHYDFINGTRMGLVRSTDRGVTWKPRMNGLRGLRIHSLTMDRSGKCVARGAMQRGTWTTADGGMLWNEVEPVPDPVAMQRFVVEAAVNSDVPGVMIEGAAFYYWEGANPDCWKSLDYGVTWSRIYVPNDLQSALPILAASDPVDATTVYLWCDTIGGAALYRADGGALYMQRVFEGNGRPIAMQIDAADPYKIYVLDQFPQGQVRFSSDGGETWVTRSNGLPEDSGVDLFLQRPAEGQTTSETLIAVFRTKGVFETHDAGLNWFRRFEGGSPENVVRAAAVDWEGDRVFLAIEDEGVLVNQGIVSTGFPNLKLTSIAYDSAHDQLYVGTESASVYRLPLSGSVNAPDSPIVTPPRDLMLHAAPNPSADRFNLSIATLRDFNHAKLTIVDVAGRYVATIYEGPLSKGTRNVAWTRRRADGAFAAPGIYLAQLRADGETSTARLVLVRR